MNYILNTPTGEKMEFYILECAEIFRLAFGGEIVEISEPQTNNSLSEIETSSK